MHISKLVFKVMWSSALANEVLASFSLACERACAIVWLYTEDMCTAIYIYTHIYTHVHIHVGSVLCHCSTGRPCKVSSQGQPSPAIAGAMQDLSHERPGPREAPAHTATLPVVQRGTGTGSRPSPFGSSASQPWGLAYAVDDTRASVGS